MAANSQQFRVRVDSSRSFNEIIHSNIETKLSELTSLVKQVALDRLDRSKSVISAFYRTILLIDALNYKMMITCLKLMPWVDLTANKRDMTHFPISTTLC
jgi:hypothetical protein